MLLERVSTGVELGLLGLLGLVDVVEGILLECKLGLSREFYYYINHRLQPMLLISLQLSVFFIHIFILDVISKFLFPFINFISLYN